MDIKKTGPWRQAQKMLSSASLQLAAGVNMVAQKEAELAQKKMREAINTEGRSNRSKWPPLSIWTRLEKGHGSKLKDTLTLLNAIKAKKKKSGSWETGVDPRAKYTDGTVVEKVASVQEDGALIVIELTARMAAYLAIRAKELGIPPKKGGTTPIGSRFYVRIPRRSFVKDTQLAHFSLAKRSKRMVLYVATGLGFVKTWKRLSK